MVEVPQELRGTDKFFSAYIEFEEVEIFKRLVGIPRTPEHQLQEKIIQLEILQNDVLVTSHKVDLSQYADMDQETQLDLVDSTGPVKSTLTYVLEMYP